jgi:hypothetical protein
VAGVNALRWGPVVGQPERARSAKRKQVAALRPGARPTPPHHFKSHRHEWEESRKKVRWRDPVNATRAGKYPATLCEMHGRRQPVRRHPIILNHTATTGGDGKKRGEGHRVSVYPQ